MSVARGSLYRTVQRTRNRGLTGLYLLVAALLVAYVSLFPGVLSLAGFSRFTQNWFPLALVTMAQALLMLNGGISLSIGPLVSLGAVIAATTMSGPLGVPGGIVLVAVTGLGVGAVFGTIVALFRLPAIIVTLAGSFIVGGVALLVLPKPGGMVPAWFSDALAGQYPTAFLLLLLVIVGWKVFMATPTGLGLYAAGDNPLGAFRSGVRVERVRIVAFALSGLLTVLAGLFVAAQTGSGDPVIGAPMTLNSIAGAVLGGVGFLGGRGTMRGALAGSLLLAAMINVMFFLGFPPVAQYVAQGLIIVAAVAVPELLSRRQRA
ncbi:ABC transporter permease [Mesorhizobium sp. RP14(2022)]|uniref:Autoinducer 2 import system permease protein LsrD n=1 Tax=Mesorhizobium liriopis TaxID=2953882 RepID=A0ABT1CC32_9HYPH|nr:ABC transporter permease [Mesorhizobium liriopis]MCO6052258.1 ABC transporter permease [Mesorhizobium liriopis]